MRSGRRSQSRFRSPGGAHPSFKYKTVTRQRIGAKVHQKRHSETRPRVGPRSVDSTQATRGNKSDPYPPFRIELGAGPGKTGKTAFFRSFSPHGEWLPAYIEFTHRVLTHRHIRRAACVRPLLNLHLSILAELGTRLLSRARPTSRHHCRSRS